MLFCWRVYPYEHLKHTAVDVEYEQDRQPGMDDTHDTADDDED